MKKITILLFLLTATAYSQYTFEQIITTPGSFDGNPAFFVIFNNEIYYTANGPTIGYGSEVWKTNGSQSGSGQVADINPGFPGSLPSNYFEFNGFLYFTADTNQITDNGSELYRTNGIQTTLVKDFGATPASGFLDQGGREQFVILNNKMYFFAISDSNMFELWNTDGTTAGTQKRVVLNTFFAPGGKGYFLEFNGELFFTMDTTDTTIDRELYKYNEAQNAVKAF